MSLKRTHDELIKFVYDLDLLSITRFLCFSFSLVLPGCPYVIYIEKISVGCSRGAISGVAISGAALSSVAISGGATSGGAISDGAIFHTANLQRPLHQIPTLAEYPPKKCKVKKYPYFCTL